VWGEWDSYYFKFNCPNPDLPDRKTVIPQVVECAEKHKDELRFDGGYWFQAFADNNIPDRNMERHGQAWRIRTHVWDFENGDVHHGRFRLFSINDK